MGLDNGGPTQRLVLALRAAFRREMTILELENGSRFWGGAFRSFL
jgi:hypothetical protein